MSVFPDVDRAILPKTLEAVVPEECRNASSPECVSGQSHFQIETVCAGGRYPMVRLIMAHRLFLSLQLTITS